MKYLVVVDVPGIKEYVFGTDRLVQIRGASAILDGFSFKLSYYGHPPEGFTGLGGLCQEQEIRDYGFFQELNLAAPLPAPQTAGWLLRHEYDLKNSWQEVLAPAVADLNAYITAVNWPGAIEEVCREERGQ